ncbi:MAG: OB-fold nucleic acid binding domain-containing protein [Thermoanaerobaculia bacterium]
MPSQQQSPTVFGTVSGGPWRVPTPSDPSRAAFLVSNSGRPPAGARRVVTEPGLGTPCMSQVRPGALVEVEGRVRPRPGSPVREELVARRITILLQDVG